MMALLEEPWLLHICSIPSSVSIDGNAREVGTVFRKWQTLALIATSVSTGSNHRIIDVFQLEGTFKGHLVQVSCNEQGHPHVDQVAQSLVQPDLECGCHGLLPDICK